MEEMLSNVAGARQVFERWMEWEPDEQAWHSYINMELRYKEIDRARSIYERFVMVHPEVKNWVKYAKFEERHSNIGNLSHSFTILSHILRYSMSIATLPSCEVHVPKQLCAVHTYHRVDVFCSETYSISVQVRMIFFKK